MADFAELQAVLAIKDNLSAGLANVTNTLGKLEGGLGNVAAALRKLDASAKQTSASMAQFAKDAKLIDAQLGGWSKRNIDKVAELKNINAELNNARTVMIGYGNSMVNPNQKLKDIALNLRNARTVMIGYGTAARQAALAQGPLATGMEQVDAISNKQIARFTKLTFKIVALQTSTFALGSVAEHAGENIKRGFDAAHVGLASFVGVITFAQGKIGFLLGGLLGIVTALSSFALSSKNANDRFNELKANVMGLRVEIFKTSEEVKRAHELGSELGSKPFEIDASILEAQISALKNLKEQVPSVVDVLTGDNGLVSQFKQFINTNKALQQVDEGKFNKILGGLTTAIANKDSQSIARGIFDINMALSDFIKKSEEADKATMGLSTGPGGGKSEAQANAARKLVAEFKPLLVVLNDYITLLGTINQLPEDIRIQKAAAAASLATDEVHKLNKSLRDLEMLATVGRGLGIADELEIARDRATLAKKQIDDLLKVIRKLEDERDATAVGSKEREIIEKKINELKNSNLGVAASEYNLAKERLKVEERIFKLKEKFAEMNIKDAFQKAVEEYTDDFITLKDVFKDIFFTMEEGFAGAFEAMMGSGKKFRDSMRQIFRDIGNSFKKMVADFLGNQFFRELLLLLNPSGTPGGVTPGTAITLASLFGGGGAAPAAVPVIGSQAAANLQSGIGGLTGTAALLGPSAAAPAGAGLFGGSGFLGMSAGLTGLLGVGGVMAASQAQDPVSGGLLGGAGGAMLGGAMVAGPIGAMIGGIIGAGIGIFSGGKAKEEEEKAKEEAEQAAQEAQEELERQRALAQDLILTQLRSRYGGGLATKEAAMTMGDLMSNGLSVDEINAFGNPAEIAAQAQQIMGAASNVNLGGMNVHVTAYINGVYDVQKLGEDIGNHTLGFIESSLAGV